MCIVGMQAHTHLERRAAWGGVGRRSYCFCGFRGMRWGWSWAGVELWSGVEPS
jgi:hypothetical protein